MAKIKERRKACEDRRSPLSPVRWADEEMSFWGQGERPQQIGLQWSPHRPSFSQENKEPVNVVWILCCMTPHSPLLLFHNSNGTLTLFIPTHHSRPLINSSNSQSNLMRWCDVRLRIFLWEICFLFLILAQHKFHPFFFFLSCFFVQFGGTGSLKKHLLHPS